MDATEKEGLQLCELKTTSYGTGMTFVGNGALTMLQRAVSGIEGVRVAMSVDQAKEMSKELAVLPLCSSCALPLRTHRV